MKSPAQRPWSVAVCIDTRDGAGRKRLHGVALYARQRGWRMMLVRRVGRDAAQEVARLRPQGVIAYAADGWLVAVARRLAIPLVDTALGEVDVPLVVSLDAEAVGRLAAELAARGRKLHAFAQTVAEGESHIEPLMRWLQGLPKPVGILAYDDKLGERVLTACRWAGLAVPNQVAVLGIGNDELMCEVSWPSLSSVSFPTQRLGFEAAEMLDQAMHGRTVEPTLRKIQTTGVAVRMSTDMLAVDDATITAAVRYIREHAQQRIGVGHGARALGVSRRTLDRRLVAVLGRTVHDELTGVRMQIARKLLTDGLHTIAEIASAAGYGTAASFSRAFRQHTGCWPSDYRSQLRVV